MSITGIGGAHQIAASQRRAESRDAFARFNVGQRLDLYVQERLAPNRYLMRFAGTQHIVETAMSLTAGATFAATVVAIGDKLELKAVVPSSGEPVEIPVVDAQPSERDDDWHSELLEEAAEQFSVTLSDVDHATVAAAMREAAQPLDMARSAVFLSKLDVPIESHALQAVYSALTWRDTGMQRNDGSGAAASASAAPDIDLQTLAAQLQQQFATDGTGPLQGADPQQVADASSQTGNDDERERLARELLNAHDEAGVAYAYGSLPVLVADQLVELDVVMFRDRQDPQAPNAMRRLVMTLQTENLGRVEVTAQALGARLTIAIKAGTDGASAALAAHADEVRELVAQLGWHVEAIDYGIDPLHTRAAREIVGHVLQIGSVNRLV